MSWIITGSFAQPDEPEALAYIAAVEAADGQALEDDVKFAYNSFIKGCKTDGIWNAIKASCILAGARTLDGALVPLAGTAPTNFNFVAGDYNRKTGLVGDGSTKYLNSNVTNTQLSADNHAFCINLTFRGSDDRGLIDLGRGATGATGIHTSSAGDPGLGYAFRSANSSFVIQSGNPGFVGLSRSSSVQFTSRLSSINQANSRSAGTLRTGTVALYRFSEGVQAYADARLSFYSIGEALDLALLDARVTTLMSNLAAAIP